MLPRPDHRAVNGWAHVWTGSACMGPSGIVAATDRSEHNGAGLENVDEKLGIGPNNSRDVGHAE
eukprot:7666536-Lingulodinium_polyedra.AAC.1